MILQNAIIYVAFALFAFALFAYATLKILARIEKEIEQTKRDREEIMREYRSSKSEGGDE